MYSNIAESGTISGTFKFIAGGLHYIDWYPHYMGMLPIDLQTSNYLPSM